MPILADHQGDGSHGDHDAGDGQADRVGQHGEVEADRRHPHAREPADDLRRAGLDPGASQPLRPEQRPHDEERAENADDGMTDGAGCDGKTCKAGHAPHSRLSE